MARAKPVAQKSKKPAPGLLERSVHELRATVESLRHMLESYLPGSTPTPKKRRATPTVKKAATKAKAASTTTKSAVKKAAQPAAKKPSAKKPATKKTARSPQARAAKAQ